MHILFLDTASAEPSLLLSTEEKILVRKMLPKQGESHITRYLEEALKEVGWRYEDLTHIACIAGPGGFVSVRVGITMANVLSHFLGTSLAGVHLSELWEARVSSPYSLPVGEGFYWLHSTRRTQLFIRNLCPSGRSACHPQSDILKYSEPVLIDLEEAATLEGAYVGELIEEHRKALPGCTPVSPSSIKALEEVLPSFLSKLSYKQEQLLPWYGREA
ncbi:MAG: hypothetical protein AAB853_04850 [Patescibacteria group bacterium]